jgi:hypothetical protein
MTTDNIVWEDLGPARAGETSGRVFRPGERLFDPNGYVRRALEGLSTKDGERWAFISIGQSDAGNYWMVTREQYAQALIAVTDAALAKGARVAIGFTSATAKPAVDAVYQERLIPGWRDALRHYKGDRRVVAGANLRLALGPLSVSQGEGPGLFPDKLHMNDAALDLAAQAWFNALVHAHVIPAH